MIELVKLALCKLERSKTRSKLNSLSVSSRFLFFTPFSCINVKGTYGDIYNFRQEAFNEVLDDQEIEEEYEDDEAAAEEFIADNYDDFEDYIGVLMDLSVCLCSCIIDDDEFDFGDDSDDDDMDVSGEPADEKEEKEGSGLTVDVEDFADCASSLIDNSVLTCSYEI